MHFSSSTSPTMSAPPPALLQQQQLLPEESLAPASPKEDAEDDQVQILVCGTSNEGTISDFVREHQLRLSGATPPPEQQQQNAAAVAPSAAAEDAAVTADAAAAAGGGGGAAYLAATSTAEACIEDVLDFDERGLAFALATAAAEPAQTEEGSGARGGSAFGGGAAAAAAGGPQQQQLSTSGNSSTDAAAGAASGPDLLADAAARGKVVMDWEVTRDRRWVYARDQSQWFNYGFDEVTFKDWVQRQLDTRIERLAHRAVFVPSVESSELQHLFVETFPAAEENVSELRSAIVEQRVSDPNILKRDFDPVLVPPGAFERLGPFY